MSRPRNAIPRHLLLYICIPAYNEAPTVGLLLWRLRSVMQDVAREYEIIVYNDGSTDATAETLQSYAEVLPLSVLGEPMHQGYGHALEALVRAVSKRTRYPRRDGMLTMQADFTDRPEDLPELFKRFEGGADLIVGEREVSDAWPAPARMLRRIAPYITRPFVKLPDIKDPFGTLRVYRISVLRDMLKDAGDKPLLHSDGWSANVEMLVRASKHSRRIETVSFSPRYELRPRETRVQPWKHAIALYRNAKALRAQAVTS
ncbi:MAG TPA: glycosyltransferase family 2 protein [Gemmatimonadaceae bacterium]|nr:glycosyltransferase family 2 protein [Gemmatimonadaceae bacterium]